jgi:hypothetical protein
LDAAWKQLQQNLRTVPAPIRGGINQQRKKLRPMLLCPPIADTQRRRFGFRQGWCCTASAERSSGAQAVQTTLEKNPP